MLTCSDGVRNMMDDSLARFYRNRLRPSTSFVSFRIIHSTSALSKQPPWDRLKYRRKFLPPYHSPPKIEDSYFSKEQYLSLEPPLAPGKWGSTPEQIKKDSFRKGEILQAIPSTFWKLQELYHLEQNLWFQKLDLPMHIPEALSFTQFITRTKLVDGLPKSNDIENKDEILNLVICSIKDMLKLETTTYNRRHISSLNADNSGIEARSRNRRRFISNLLETACSTIASALPDSTLSTRPIQTDEKCLVETFFKKAGYTKLGNEADDLYESIFPEINETVKDSDGFVRYRLRGELAWALRTCDPLLPFVTMTDSACFEGPVPVHDYAPEMYDLLPVDCFSFSSMPFCRNHFSSEFARSVAGE
ncbi:unnamed protein product [Protopolystoma xenopodis]|uniref:Uncharacterized protein n=1 Tax=Protopolystoma xenopodis TaxID=117903 RepID=A0A448XG10_9PLAT|nr:unnamed protein product [Protopolystoma xenopodis]